MATPGPSPSKYQPIWREGHQTHIIDDKLYMWVGAQEDLPCVHSNGGKLRITSRVEVMDLMTGEWSQHQTKGNPPLGVFDYASAVVGRNIYYFGGYCGHDKCHHNSLYCLNVDNMTWREIASTNGKEGPMMKCSCGMAAIKINGEDYLLVIGGYGPSTNTPKRINAQYEIDCEGDIITNEHHYYRLTSGKWISMSVSGTFPLPSYGFSLTSLTTDWILMFGGHTSDDNNINDVYIGYYNELSVHWEKISQPPGTSVVYPKGRSYHTTGLLDDHHIIVIGGRYGKDSWIFDISNRQWRKFPLPQSVTNRWYHSLSVWKVNDDSVCMLVFGGRNNNGIINDTTISDLSWDGEVWSMGEVMTHPFIGYERNLLLMKRRQNRSNQPSSAIVRKKEREIEELQEEKRLMQERFQQEMEQQLHRERLLHQQLQEKHQQIQNQQQQLDQLRGDVVHLERRVHQLEHESSWIVRRDEITITDNVIGRGGWGTVSVAHFRGTIVAAKCLHDVIISPYNIDIFTHEIEIASKIRHPNLLQFIGATREGSPVILIELIPTSLRKQLESGVPLPYPAILTISHDVACGLNYLHLFHPHPILHRDVSSANVLLQPIGTGWRAKVSDYGSANLQSMIGTTVNPGNLIYSAPEADRPSLHSPAMDIYSYGVLVLEMMVCALPVVSKRRRHINSIRRPAIKGLIERCIKDDRTQRPSMNDIISELNDTV